MIGQISTQFQPYTSFKPNLSKPDGSIEAGKVTKSTANSSNNTAADKTTSSGTAAEDPKYDGQMDKVTLSKDETVEVEKLKQRDQEVRTHEQAHKAAAGRHSTGAASFEFQIGPDGKRYAVGGEVGIDLSPGRTPEETVQKASAVRAAALAPAEPSAQDRKVAAAAAQMEQKARQELASAPQKEKAESRDEDTSGEETPASSSTEIPALLNNSGAAPALAPTESENETRPAKGPIDAMTGDSSNSAAAEKKDSESSNVTLDRITPRPDKVRKSYQENTPSSLSPIDTATAGTVYLSMAI